MGERLSPIYLCIVMILSPYLKCAALQNHSFLLLEKSVAGERGKKFRLCLVYQFGLDLAAIRKPI